MQVMDNTDLAIALVHVCEVYALESSSSYSGKYVCMYVGRGVSPVWMIVMRKFLRDHFVRELKKVKKKTELQDHRMCLVGHSMI